MDQDLTPSFGFLKNQGVVMDNQINRNDMVGDSQYILSSRCGSLLYYGQFPIPYHIFTSVDEAIRFRSAHGLGQNWCPLKVTKDQLDRYVSACF